jgi:DNA polymerase-3 subunit delta'
MLFKDLIGQDRVGVNLRTALQAERYPHALLLLGSEGCGKLPLALAMAQYLLCQQPTAEDSCGVCAACTKAQRWIHPDLHFSFPTVGKNVRSDDLLEQWRQLLADQPYASVQHWLQFIGAENKQGNINKEECVNITRKLSLKTFENQRKVLVMWRPEYLGKEGNRLLKLIEEPPADTYFIFVAEQSDQILNTILSGCQIMKVPPLSIEAVENALVANGNDPTKAKQAAQLSNGNYFLAQQLITDEDRDHVQVFIDWMRLCYQGDMVKLVSWVNQFATVGREQQKFFLQYALHFMREYLFYSTTDDLTNVRLSEVEKDIATKFRKIIGFHQVDNLVTLFNDLIYYVERNANPKVLFLDASLSIHQFLKPAVVS